MSARLSAPQKRHLDELLGDGEKTLYWKVTYGGAEHRCAEALAKKGLVVQYGSLISRAHDGGYTLTDKGREVALELRSRA